jgi:hypothetical protein
MEPFKILNMDTTWLQPLVKEIFELFPNTNAYCIRAEVMDNNVVLNAIPDEALAAIQSLKKKISKVKLSSKSKWIGTIPLRNSTHSFANMIRRGIMTRVKVPAITECFIGCNTSKYTPDEIIAHRIGQLALTGAGLPLEFQANIKVKGRSVLASDIPGVFHGEEIVIAELDADEAFEARVVGRWGSVLLDKHAKFNGVASVEIHPVWVTRSNSTKIRTLLKSHGIICQSVGKGYKLRRADGSVLRREFVTELWPECSFEIPVDFDIHFESLGQLDAHAVFQSAIESVMIEINEFEKSLRQSNPLDATAKDV